MSDHIGASGAVSARVSVTAHPLWRIRLTRDAPRYLMSALSLAGIAASVRFALDPPTPTLPKTSLHAARPADRAAEGYAVLFARRYLTWNATVPQDRERSLEPFLGVVMEAGAGIQLPTTGEQHVEWAEVVQTREPVRGGHVYTIAVQTDTGGLQYLTVGVTRTPDGSLSLSGYPAFVGAPTALGAQHPQRLREVSDSKLAMVLQRALRNYLAASPSELAADLVSDARVSSPTNPLSLETVERLDWSTVGTSLLAVVQARDERGVQYTLAYEVEVERTQGRWEVSAVQMDPDT